MVDTGSVGLRIMSSALNSCVASALPAVTVTSQALAECYQYADGYNWGPVVRADVKMGGSNNAGETANSMNVQVVNDSAFGGAPNPGCTGTGNALDTVYSFGANGVLGVGLYVNDCATGNTCPVRSPGLYYGCPSGGVCAPIPVPSANQVANPVAFFVTDNNGVILELPGLGAGAAASNPHGALVFGINTEGNNATISQVVYATDPLSGNINSQLTNIPGYAGAGVNYTYSFFDSGSNGIYLPGTYIPCDSTNGWFIPGSTLNIGANIQGASTAAPPNPAPILTKVSFQVANANNLPGGASSTAFSQLAAPATTCTNGLGSGVGTGSNSGIDWGTPFLYGKNLYVALETTTLTISSTKYYGPFWAY